MLDTGSEGSSIDPSSASKLGLETHGTERIQKNFRDLVIDFTKVDQLTIGSKDFKQVKLAEVTLAPISKALGIAVDGVLGTDILGKFTFKISNKEHTD
jgi:Aspartyl protease